MRNGKRAFVFEQRNETRAKRARQLACRQSTLATRTRFARLYAYGPASRAATTCAASVNQSLHVNQPPPLQPNGLAPPLPPLPPRFSCRPAFVGQYLSSRRGQPALREASHLTAIQLTKRAVERLNRHKAVQHERGPRKPKLRPPNGTVAAAQLTNSSQRQLVYRQQRNSTPAAANRLSSRGTIVCGASSSIALRDSPLFSSHSSRAAQFADEPLSATNYLAATAGHHLRQRLDSDAQLQRQQQLQMLNLGNPRGLHSVEARLLRGARDDYCDQDEDDDDDEVVDVESTQLEEAPPLVAQQFDKSSSCRPHGAAAPVQHQQQQQQLQSRQLAPSDLFSQSVATSQPKLVASPSHQQQLFCARQLATSYAMASAATSQSKLQLSPANSANEEQLQRSIFESFFSHLATSPLDYTTLINLLVGCGGSGAPHQEPNHHQRQHLMNAAAATHKHQQPPPSAINPPTQLAGDYGGANIDAAAASVVTIGASHQLRHQFVGAANAPLNKFAMHTKRLPQFDSQGRQQRHQLGCSSQASGQLAADLWPSQLGNLAERITWQPVAALTSPPPPPPPAEPLVRPQTSARPPPPRAVLWRTFEPSNCAEQQQQQDNDAGAQAAARTCHSSSRSQAPDSISCGAGGRPTSPSNRLTINFKDVTSLIITQASGNAQVRAALSTSIAPASSSSSTSATASSSYLQQTSSSANTCHI